MVRKGADDGFLPFAAVVNSEMGTPPMSLADERILESNAAAAAAYETRQDAAAAAQAAAAAAATTREAATSALKQQKDALDAILHAWEMAHVAYFGAEAHATQPDLIQVKLAMVQEAGENTLLSEADINSFDPATLPSPQVALARREEAREAMRVLVAAYDAALEQLGIVDDTRGEFARAMSLSLPPPPARRAGGVGAGDDDDEGDDKKDDGHDNDNDDAPLPSSHPPPPAHRVHDGEQGCGGGDVNTNASTRDREGAGTTNGNDHAPRQLRPRRNTRRSAQRGAAVVAPVVMGPAVNEEGDREMGMYTGGA